MAKTRVFSPKNFQELFLIWNKSSFPEGSGEPVLYAGGSEIIRDQCGVTPKLPQNIISLDKIEELSKIRRSERYLEIGGMVKLNQILRLGKIVPEALRKCLLAIADPEVRNLATIGGNINNSSRKLDISSPMIALDAQYELKTAQSSRWIAASRFSSFSDSSVLEKHELLTRIRVPLEPWTFTWYRKFNNSSSNKSSGAMLFIVKIEKNILMDIRVIYSGKSILREKNSEKMLASKHLPLNRKDVRTFVDKWRTYLTDFEGSENPIFSDEEQNFSSELSIMQILNFIETTLMHISD